MTDPRPLRPFELGIYELAPGESPHPVAAMRDLLEAIELADRVGLDVFAIGERTRDGALSAAPAVILGAAAARTTSIRLAMSLTLLPSDDPLRIWQTLHTLDVLSGDRAELMLGSALFPAPREAADHSRADRSPLAFDTLDDAERIAWSDRLRTQAAGLPLAVHPVQEPLPIRVMIGPAANTVMQAASLGLPAVLTIAGALAERAAPYFHLYREVARAHEFKLAALPLSVIAYGSLTSGSTSPDSHHLYDSEYAGTPDQVIHKILFHHELFSHQRLTLYLSDTTIDHERKLRAIELLGTHIAPAVRAAIARRSPPEFSSYSKHE